jgi:hypothetical protein
MGKFGNLLQRCLLAGILTGLSASVFAAPDDAPGSKDHPLLTRYPDSHITEYQQNYNSVEFLTEANSDQRKVIEGDTTFIRYFYNQADTQPSPLQLIRNYQNAIKSIGGEVVYERLPRDGDGGETTLKVATGSKDVWVRVEPDI